MRKSIFSVLGPTDPVYDLTTVDAVNAALDLDGNTDDDAVTAAQITAASKMIGELCNRTFAMLEVSESFRVQWAEPMHMLYLRQYPVEQLTSVMQDGSEADASLYELDDEAGLLWMKCGRWCGEIVVAYSGGYDLPDEAPALLAQACIELVAAQQLFATSAATDPNVRQVQHGDSAVSYFGPAVAGATGGSGTVPQSVMSLINNYIERRI